MKRILSVTAALLLLLLALAGCGGTAQEATETESAETAATETAETPETEAPAEAEPAQAAEPAAETAAESTGLAALADRMIAEAGITDAIPVSSDVLITFYSLDPSQIAEAAGYNASAAGAFPQEIILVKAVDEDAAANVAIAFINHLSNIASQAESYDPDSKALADQCPVITKGNYVGLFFSEHYQQLTELFENGVQ
jgi:glucose/arabinose dehydrogenase